MKLNKCAFGLVLAGAVSLAPVAWATLTINNPSFESQVLGDGVPANGNPTSWSSTGPSTSWGVLNPNSTYINGAGVSTLPSPGEGANVAYIDTQNTIGSKIIYQGISSVDQTGNYTFTLAVADRYDNVNSGTPLVELLAGSSFATASLLTPASSTTPNPNINKGTLVQWTLNYNLTAGQNIWIELSNTGAGNTEVDFDNLQITAVPEPVNVALGMFGGLAVLWWGLGLCWKKP